MTERLRIHRLLVELNKQSQLPFPSARLRINAPSAHGVYVIRGPRGRVLHVGRTLRGKNGLSQRLRDHLLGNSSFVKSYFGGRGAVLRRGYTYQYLEVPKDRPRALLEYLATAWHCPAHLGVGAAKKAT